MLLFAVFVAWVSKIDSLGTFFLLFAALFYGGKKKSEIFFGFQINLLRLKSGFGRKKILVEWKMGVSLHSLSPKKRNVEKRAQESDSTLTRMKQEIACVWGPSRGGGSRTRRVKGEIQSNSYNEEFDPGSGWTLAAGLTHASRGAAGCSNTVLATGARACNAYATYLITGG